MKSVRGLVVVCAVLLMLCGSPAWAGGTSDATIDITATVDSFAEWANATPSIAAVDWTGSVDGASISQVGESLTVSKALTLYANANVVITATATANGGIATNGTETLTTSYMITGDIVGGGDGDYVAAGAGVGQFFNAANHYHVTHVSGDGSYTVNLGVKLESPNNRAVDAGDYTCSIKLTATW
jgi:hypothetical protein